MLIQVLSLTILFSVSLNGLPTVQQQMSCIDFNPVLLYNAFFSGNFQGSSDVQGRIAVGGNAEFMPGFSVGDQLSRLQAYDVTTIIGGSLVWTSGRNYFGNIVVGANSPQISNTVLDNGCQVILNPAALDFGATQKSLIDLSSSLANLPSTVVTSNIEFGLISLKFSGTANIEVVTLAGSTFFNNVSDIASLQGVKSGAVVVFNIRGASPGLVNMNQEALIGASVIFNFPDATLLTIQGVSVRGGILAPHADIKNAMGQINGPVYAASMSGSCQINLAPLPTCPPPSVVVVPPPPVVATPPPSPPVVVTPPPPVVATPPPSPPVVVTPPPSPPVVVTPPPSPPVVVTSPPSPYVVATLSLAVVASNPTIIATSAPGPVLSSTTEFIQTTSTTQTTINQQPSTVYVKQIYPGATPTFVLSTTFALPIFVSSAVAVASSIPSPLTTPTSVSVYGTISSSTLSIATAYEATAFKVSTSMVLASTYSSSCSSTVSTFTPTSSLLPSTNVADSTAAPSPTFTSLGLTSTLTLNVLSSSCDSTSTTQSTLTTFATSTALPVTSTLPILNTSKTVDILAAATSAALYYSAPVSVINYNSYVSPPMTPVQDNAVSTTTLANATILPPYVSQSVQAAATAVPISQPYVRYTGVQAAATTVPVSQLYVKYGGVQAAATTVPVSETYQQYAAEQTLAIPTPPCAGKLRNSYA